MFSRHLVFREPVLGEALLGYFTASAAGLPAHCSTCVACLGCVSTWKITQITTTYNKHLTLSNPVERETELLYIS